MVDATGASVYTFNSIGQLLSEDGPWASDTVSYTYDNGRRRSGLTLLAPNASAWTQSYGYDAANRLTNITSPAGAFTYAYDGTRQLQVNKLTLPSTAYITNTFDSVARLTGTYLKNSGNTNLNYHTYSYNLGNQRTEQVFTAGNYVDYTYDNIGQLKTALGKESGGTTNRLQEQLGYAYDAAGNLNWRTNNALVQAFNVNTLNELTTATNSGTLTVAGTTTSSATNVTVNSQTAAVYLDNTFAKDGFTVTNGNNAYTAIGKDSYGRKDTNSITFSLSTSNNYTYDLNGNLLYDGNRAFDYDDENQLIRVTVTNGWKSEFTYDGKLRRRIRKEFKWTTSWVQTNEVRYIYDGNLVIQERDANNLPTVSSTRGRDLSGSLEGAGGIGGLLARTDHGSQLTAFYHADGNGNVIALINAQQIIVAKYLYDPFGNVLSQSGSLADANLYRFSSKEYNPNSGLVYYLYRFYEPSLQRWPNQDPIGERGGINLYGFVGNSPLNRVDRLGLDAAIINHGGYTGHTSFVIVQSDGSVTAYHFYAKSHQTGRCCGLGSVLAVCCDKVSVWQESANSLQDYMASQEKLGGGAKIVAYAFGTSLDDQLSLEDLNEQDKADAGIYSLALGVECHKKSWDWFNEYLEGGQQIYPTLLPGQQQPPYWPERWFETRRHRLESLPQVPAPPSPTPGR